MSFLLLFFAFSIPSQAESYFPKDYTEARKRFQSYSSKEKRQFILPSSKDSNLTIDSSYLPAQKNSQNLVILASGVHGVEAFAGSAIQFLFLEKILPKVDMKNTGYLLIHSINPYGYKFLRRVSENNVDLNRNFSFEKKHFKKKNPGYSKVNGVLNPNTPVNLRSFDYYFSFVEMIWLILRHSMKPLRQAILQGQHEHANGLYFGGLKPEPQNIFIFELIQKTSRKYKNILLIDLHTGFGERGKLHLFGPTNPSRKIQKNIELVFQGQTIVSGNDDDFYTVHGDLSEFVAQATPEKSNFIPMTFEFGTLNSQTYKGSLQSISNMIIENQGHHHGFHSPRDEKETKKRMLEMYNPSDPAWRKKVLEQAEKSLFSAIKNLKNLEK